MSLHSMLVANHLNRIRSGANSLTFPEVKHTESTNKVALSLICMGFGLREIGELCLKEKQN
jgi:hypothetical protein